MNLEHIVQAATDEQRLDELIAHLQRCYKDEQRIYHPLGKYGMVVLNPGLRDVNRPPQDLDVLYGLLDRILPTSGSGDSHSQAHQTGDYAVIATGISGAGKTTVMRHVLKRVLGLENQEQDQGRKDHTIVTDKSTKTINDNLEATLVIVDAMGNAQTRNNTDSSRMVKVIQISNPGPNPTVTVRVMMLENTRMLHLRPASPLVGTIKEASTGSVDKEVPAGSADKDVSPISIDKEVPNTSPDRPERSFHILYYLLAKGHPALDEQTVRELYPKTMRVEGDLSGYDHVHKAMKIIAGPESRIPEISWNAIAAVALLMAARNFADPRTKRAYETLGNPNLKELKASIPEAAVKDDAHQDELEKAELHARSKALYLCIFDYWTGKANRKGSDSAGKRTVSIFDICGFEILKENRLPQLLLNDFYEKILSQVRATQEMRTTERTSSDPKAVMGDQTCAHQIINMMSETHLTEPCDLEGIFTTARETGKGKVQINGIGKSLKLKLRHLENSPVEYQHENFFAENEIVRRKDFLSACQELLPMLASTAVTNPLLETSAVRQTQSDWRDVKKVLQHAHVSVINCVKASPSLDSWVFEPGMIRPQIINSAIMATLKSMRVLQMDIEATKANFATQYGRVLPQAMADHIKATTRGSTQRVQATIDSLLQWLSEQDQKSWIQGYHILRDNMIFYKQALADRLEEAGELQQQRQSQELAEGEQSAHAVSLDIPQTSRSELSAAVSAALAWFATEEAGGTLDHQFFNRIIDPLLRQVNADLPLMTGLHVQAVISTAIMTEAVVQLSAGSDKWDHFCTSLVGMASSGTTQDLRGSFIQYTIEHVRNRVLVEAGLNRTATEQARLYSLAERLSRASE